MITASNLRVRIWKISFWELIQVIPLFSLKCKPIMAWSLCYRLARPSNDWYFTSKNTQKKKKIKSWSLKICARARESRYQTETQKFSSGFTEKDGVLKELSMGSWQDLIFKMPDCPWTSPAECLSCWTWASSTSAEETGFIGPSLLCDHP